MKVTYNEDKRKFNVIYFDAVKELKGDTYPYTRKQISWKGKKKPTQKEVKFEIARLEEEYKVIEQSLLLEANKLKETEQVITNEGEEINAVLYFTNLKVKDVATKAQSDSCLSKVQRHIDRFKNFLKENYSLITLDKIKKSHIEEYFTTLSNYCQQEQKAHYTYLKKIFNKVVNDNEESTIKYTNPLNKIEWEDLITPKKQNKKIGFTTQQVKNIMELFCSAGNKGSHEEQKFGIFYFLIVTGWRISDILNLTWEQVDMTNRTITITHGKTELTTGHETVIFITPLMMNILERMKNNQKEFPFNTQLVFNHRTYGTQVKKPEKYVYVMQRTLYPILTKMGIMKQRTNDFNKIFNNYTLHCFRKTVITELTLAKFGEVSINYLTGHANNTVEGKHYLNLITYPERSTRKMIEHMEEHCDLLYYWLLLTTDKATAQKQLYKMNKWLKSSVIEDLKNNFWTDKAIEKLEELYESGVNALLIETIIKLCNVIRTEQSASEVTVKMVDDFYMMSRWLNLEDLMKQKLAQSSLRGVTTLVTPFFLNFRLDMSS